MALKAEVNRLRERIEELERGQEKILMEELLRMWDAIYKIQNSKPKLGRPKKEDARVGT